MSQPTCAVLAWAMAQAATRPVHATAAAHGRKEGPSCAACQERRWWAAGAAAKSRRLGSCGWHSMAQRGTGQRGKTTHTDTVWPCLCLALLTLACTAEEQLLISSMGSSAGAGAGAAASSICGQRSTKRVPFFFSSGCGKGGREEPDVRRSGRQRQERDRVRCRACNSAQPSTGNCGAL